MPDSTPVYWMTSTPAFFLSTSVRSAATVRSMSAASTTSIFCRRLGEPGFDAPAGDDDAFRKATGCENDPQRAARDPARERSRARVAGDEQRSSRQRRRSVPGHEPVQRERPAASVVVVCTMAPWSSRTVTRAPGRSSPRPRRRRRRRRRPRPAREPARTDVSSEHANRNRSNGTGGRDDRRVTERAMALPPRARRRTNVGDRLRVEGRPEAGGSSAHFLSSQKVDRKNPWVGLLARKERIADGRFAGRFTFPGCWTEWLFEATRLHSQWRDRAGFAPDFPFMPSWAPKARRDPITPESGRDGGRRANRCGRICAPGRCKVHDRHPGRRPL